jgi:predicted RNase H-like HicB family nuclease
MASRKVRYLSIVIEPNDDGYLARAPGIQGGFAEGDTIEEAIFNCVDVVKMIGVYRNERGESLGMDEFVLGTDTRVSVALPVEIR